MTRIMRTGSMPVAAVTLVMAVACGSPQSTTEPATEGGPSAAVPAAAGAAEVAFKSDPETPRMGENTFEVMVMQDGQPVDDATVSVEFFMPAMPSMNMAEMRTKADLMPAGGGVYRGTGQVMMAGNWEVTVMAMRNGQEIASRRLTVAAK